MLFSWRDVWTCVEEDLSGVLPQDTQCFLSTLIVTAGIAIKTSMTRWWWINRKKEFKRLTDTLPTKKLWRVNTKNDCRGKMMMSVCWIKPSGKMERRKKVKKQWENKVHSDWQVDKKRQQTSEVSQYDFPLRITFSSGGTNHRDLPSYTTTGEIWLLSKVLLKLLRLSLSQRWYTISRGIGVSETVRQKSSFISNAFQLEYISSDNRDLCNNLCECHGFRPKMEKIEKWCWQDETVECLPKDRNHLKIQRQSSSKRAILFRLTERKRQ